MLEENRMLEHVVMGLHLLQSQQHVRKTHTVSN